MNIQEYKESGIIESYVLGLASQREKQEFERLLEVHPELRVMMEEFERAIEIEAFANAVTPSPGLRETILSSVKEAGGAKLVTISLQKSMRSTPGRNWAVAACMALLAGCGYLVYTFYTQNQKLKGEIAQSRKNANRLDDKKRLIDEGFVPQGYLIKPASVSVPQQAELPLFEVFWDSTSTNVYIIIKHLKQLPVGQRYELWSVTKGEKESLGIFDPPKDDKLIIKMNNVQEAESFTITIFDPAKLN